MDPTTLLPFPIASLDPMEADLVEIDAAIALVATGVATRVRLVSLKRPDSAAAIGLAHAQDAGVAFRLDRERSGPATLTLGPRR